MILKNNTQGYGYKYCELSEIVKALEEQGMTFYQYTDTDPNTLKDYIYTVIVDKDGKERKALRGSEIILATLSGKNNPAQEMGASLTYARRYSLLMALGLATEDDDAKSLDGSKKIEPKKVENKTNELITKVQDEQITKLTKGLNLSPDQVLADIKNFKKERLCDLTKTEADKYIAVLNHRVAKNGK